MTFKATKTIAKGNGMIPVVRGSANYSRFAPPHSYINVRVSPKTYEIRIFPGGIPLWRNSKQGVADPDEFYPDPDSTFEKNRIRIRPSRKNLRVNLIFPLGLQNSCGAGGFSETPR